MCRFLSWILWIWDLCFRQNQWFEVKDVLIMKLFITNTQLLTSLDSWGLLVNCCDVFISCLDSHFNGTHSLQRSMWCNDNISPNLFWWRNKLIYIIDGPRMSTFSASLHFRVHCSFKLNDPRFQWLLLFFRPLQRNWNGQLTKQRIGNTKSLNRRGYFESYHQVTECTFLRWQMPFPKAPD